MQPQIIGISGSPIKNSNTDRLVQSVFESSGLKSEFVKLSKINVRPCIACLGCKKDNICKHPRTIFKNWPIKYATPCSCRNTNSCEIRDDGVVLAEKAKNADAIVIGGYTPYSSLDSRTKGFMECLYPLRHNHGYLQGKPEVAVVTSAVPSEMQASMPALEMGVNAIKFFMKEEGMNYLGAVECLGNVPCVKCENNTECRMSGIKMIYGKKATPESVGINTFEEQYEIIEHAYRLGERITTALNKS